MWSKRKKRNEFCKSDKNKKRKTIIDHHYIQVIWIKEFKKIIQKDSMVMI